jgi:hypothetical protein
MWKPVIALVVAALVHGQAQETALFGSNVASVVIDVPFVTGSNGMPLANREYPAEVNCGTRTLRGARLAFQGSQSHDDADAPSFVLSFPGGTEVERTIGTTNVEFSPLAGGALSVYAAMRMADRAGILVLPVNHAVVRMNGRGMGLYVASAKGLDWVARRRTEMRFYRLGGDLPEMRKALSSLEESNFVTRLAGICLTNDAVLRHSGFRRMGNLDELCRLSAFEGIAGSRYGFGAGGGTWVFGVDPRTESICYIPELPSDAFSALLRPVLAGNRGMLGQALMETLEVRNRCVGNIVGLMTNRAFEEALFGDIRERQRRLEELASGPREVRRIQFQARILTDGITRRFASVREQLQLDTNGVARLAGGFGNSLKLVEGKHGRALPVRSQVDYGGKFEEAAASGAGLVPSIPVRLHQIELDDPAGILRKLHWKSTNWVSLNLKIDGRCHTNVLLRLRGHGTRQAFNKKPTFTLKLGKGGDAGLFDGNTRVQVHNSLYDPSYLNHFIASWLFQRAGVPVARTEFAEVKLNSQSYGLFVLSEGVTRHMLKRSFGGEDGILWEGAFSDLDGHLDLDSGSPPPGYRRAAEAATVAKEAAKTPGRFNELSNYIDIAEFSRFAACEVILGHRDGYGFNRNNYRVYQTSASSPFSFIPHGTDALALEMEPLFPEQGIVARALTRSGPGRTAYAGAMTNMVATALDMDVLVRDAVAVTRLVQPVLRAVNPQAADIQARKAAEQMRLLGDRREYISRRMQMHQEFLKGRAK